MESTQGEGTEGRIVNNQEANFLLADMYGLFKVKCYLLLEQCRKFVISLFPNLCDVCELL
jgi:hypothetical protein